jgi:S1-C subfamily serine protease
MSLRQSVSVLGLLLCGVILGVVISERMSARQERAEAGAEDQRNRPSPLPQASGIAGLPDLTAIAERAIRASVNISSTAYLQTDPLMQFWFGADPIRPRTSLGSGVIISPDGLILTNSHVVEGGRDVRVTLGDNRELQAAVEGTDPWTDLALLKVTGDNLPMMAWGDSSRLRVAEWVLAVGNPYSFSQSVTAGIVSALNRPDPQGESFSDFIQTDAAINPGNSGGALVNTRGELVGINTMIWSRTGGYQGIGFAVPSNLAREIADKLKADGAIIRGSIGRLTFRTLTAAEAQSVGLPGGVLIEQMFRDDSAYRAGLLPDDIIVACNGKPVTDAASLRRLLSGVPIGQRVRVGAVRGRKQFDANVEVVQLPPPPRR